MLNFHPALCRRTAGALGLAVWLGGLSLGAAVAQAQTGGHDHAAHAAAAAAAASSASATDATPALTDAEIRKIDPASRKITLKHAEITHLGMPPMTMVFQVQDAALLQPFKPGDLVRFRVEKIGGAYVVTRLEARP